MQDATKAEQEPVQDLFLRRTTEQETSLTRFDWLHEFEESATHDQPSGKHSPPHELVEALLASF